MYFAAAATWRSYRDVSSPYVLQRRISVDITAAFTSMIYYNDSLWPTQVGLAFLQPGTSSRRPIELVATLHS